MTDSVRLERPALPILHACNAIVIDGSFAGMAAALALARSGHSVAIVEPRTYLGREITANLHYWVNVPPDTDHTVLPELIAGCIEASGTSPVNGEYPLHPDAIKRRLEDILLDAGVRIIYASLPVGLVTEDEQVAGVIIGNKSGRQVVTCQAILDTSPTALTARLAGATFERVTPRAAPFSLVLEFERVDPLAAGPLSVSPSLGLIGERAIAHRGYRGPQHVLVECTLPLPYPITDAFALTERDIAARHKAVDLAIYLLANIPAFGKAELTTISYELLGPTTARLLSPPPVWAEQFVVAVMDNPQLPLSAFAGPLRGIWCVNDATRLDDETRLALYDCVMSTKLGDTVARVLLDNWAAATAPRLVSTGHPPTPAHPDAHVHELKQPRYKGAYAWCAIPPSHLSVGREVDVLVAGGGTSGAVAAITAAQTGASTCVVDMNPGLGGTGTYGGTHSYWFGRPVGFSARSLGWVNAVQQRLHLEPAEGEIPAWNIEAKVLALTNQAQLAGAHLLLNAIITGALADEHTVGGVIVATRCGPIAIRAKVTIDATGDGDVAAFAGAEYTYGAQRDHSVMWYTLHQFSRPGHTRNNFTSTVDVGDIEDYNRAILAARRRGKIGNDHDHGIYVATRESRHMCGDVILTMTDTLLHRAWPDVVSIAFSNNDIKGHATSDWFRMGLIPPNLEVEIPYRALIPRGFDNILVVGKAFSSSHDAFPALRMQRDLENLGGVAALAAVQAVRTGKTTRSLDIPTLQASLVEAGVLPEGILSRQLVPLRYSGTEIEEIIATISADRPLHSYSDMELNVPFTGRIPVVDVCCAGPQAIPLLASALDGACGPRQVLFAQMLAMMGSQAGVPVLVNTIMRQMANGALPVRTATIRHANRYAPDQAAMPDTAYLLHSLGMARDRRALPVWQRVVDLLATASEADVCDQSKGIFHYVDAVCCGAERLGDPDAIPILEQLHSYTPFHDHYCASGFQPDFLKERLAYLELVICRALARCGSRTGLARLAQYMSDARAILARHAYDEYMIVSKAQGKPLPWSVPTDAVAAWSETVLVPQH